MRDSWPDDDHPADLFSVPPDDSIVEDGLEVLDPDPVATGRLPGMDPVADALAELDLLDPPPVRADQPGRGWMLLQVPTTCAWCGRPCHTGLVRHDQQLGLPGGIDGYGAHPACEATHYGHGLRVARALVRLAAEQTSPLQLWSRLQRATQAGPQALALGADCCGSDGVFILPEQAGLTLLDDPVECRRCTLPTHAHVTLAGLSVVGPQHWRCLEATTYQGLPIRTLEEELYPGSRAAGAA